MVTSLAEAAKKAIAAHNTSVSVEIRASPAPSVAGSVDDDGDESDEEEDPQPQGKGGRPEDEDEEDEEEDEPHGSEPEDNYFADHMGRKHSVVSVSTTISMKSETLSPPASLRPQNSQGSATGDESESEEDPQSALDALGSPPYFRALLLLAQMSSANNHFTPEYTRACVQAARANRDFVMGYIAQQSLNERSDDNFITMTPGVQLAAGGDGKGQQYNTPRKVIEGGTDVIIVGRGIIMAPDRKAAALEYRKQGWAAYLERIRAGRRTRR